MVLVNVIAFAVFETLHNLVSMQKSLFAKNNCWNTQNYEKCPIWPNLYFFGLSGTVNNFVKTRLVLEIKKRQYLKMRKRFVLTRAANWQLSFLY